ncbi:hypothetical protein HMPREF0077_1660 [Anaerococcus tetradius ATCC 35098]|uniref:Uncharacterized protein n=1 Tax=Anaerococcus tetradius ATCC 35098 TaxID=525255 RepID=C2CJK0_9FIRM|nr:hypothetical protein HMPREF0077_1660 [Anaerococcus tetradius ATCC 35098]
MTKSRKDEIDLQWRSFFFSPVTNVTDYYYQKLYNNKKDIWR